MSRIGAIWALALALFQAAAAAAPSVQVETTRVALKAPPYELIQFVTEGEPYGPVTERIRGRFHRLVVLSPGIAYDHPTLRIETLTYGDEACCLRLVAAYELPLEKLGDHGITLPEATRAQLKFRRWLGTRALEVAYGPLACVFSRIGNPTISVACQP